MAVQFHLAAVGLADGAYHVVRSAEGCLEQAPLFDHVDAFSANTLVVVDGGVLAGLLLMPFCQGASMPGQLCPNASGSPARVSGLGVLHAQYQLLDGDDQLGMSPADYGLVGLVHGHVVLGLCPDCLGQRAVDGSLLRALSPAQLADVFGVPVSFADVAQASVSYAVREAGQELFVAEAGGFAADVPALLADPAWRVAFVARLHDPETSLAAFTGLFEGLRGVATNGDLSVAGPALAELLGAVPSWVVVSLTTLVDLDPALVRFRPLLSGMAVPA